MMILNEEDDSQLMNVITAIVIYLNFLVVY